MKLSDAFQSNFLKASDLAGKTVTVTIESVDMEELGKGRDKEAKLIIGFVGKAKKLVCNKTNAGTIAKLYGDETDNWLGKPITIAAREVEFQGDMVWAIRVSLQKPGTFKQAAAPAPAPAQLPPSQLTEPPDGFGEPASDEPPF